MTGFYQRLHDSIIAKAKLRGLDKSKFPDLDLEKHHILPTALGGPDVLENKVLLTFPEHFAVHFLLTKVLTGQDKHRMRGAMTALAMDCTGRRCINAMHLAVARRQTSIRMTEAQLARSANGTHAWQTEEYKAGRSAAMTEMNLTSNPSKKPKNKAAAAARMKQEFVCEHCGDMVHGSTNYKRRHHDNCKFKTHTILATRLSDNARFVFGSFSSAYAATQAPKLDKCLLGARANSGGYTFKYIAKETAASHLLLRGICIVTDAVKTPAYTACPHCGTIGSHNASSMNRWHFDNCLPSTASSSQHLLKVQPVD